MVGSRNLLICTLSLLLSVACSKKSSGGADAAPAADPAAGGNSTAVDKVHGDSTSTATESSEGPIAAGGAGAESSQGGAAVGGAAVGGAGAGGAGGNASTKLNPNESCIGKCGSFDSDAPCACDSLCQEMGDCCSDYLSLCGGDTGGGGNTVPDVGTGSCQSACGEFYEQGPCNCDDYCVAAEDCCPDYSQFCNDAGSGGGNTGGAAG